MKHRLLSLLVCSLSLLLASSLSAQYSHPELLKMEKQVQRIVEKNRPAIITVIGTTPGSQGSGTATIISAEGLVLTAAHVLGQNKEMMVVFPDGKRGKAKSLGCNYDRDLALAQLEGDGPWPYAELGDSENVEIAQIFVAMGHAGGYDPRRPAPPRIGRSSHTGKSKFIVTDCVLIGGDSGGPLFDLDGKVVGVHSSIGQSLSQNNHAPVHVAQEDWERLLKGDKWGSGPGAAKPKPREPETDPTKQPALGVRFDDEAKDDLTISEVIENGPAAKGGFEKGDVIIRIGGTATPNREKFFETFLLLKPGQKLKVAVKRGRGIKVLDVTLGKRGEIFKPSSFELGAWPVEVPADFDKKKFAAFLTEKARSSGGKLQLDLKGVRKSLVEFGLSEAEVASMDDKEALKLITESLAEIGDVKKIEKKEKKETAEEKPAAPAKEEKKPKESSESAKNLDVDGKKLARALASESQRSGEIKLGPELARKLLSEAGADKKKLASLSDEEAVRQFVRGLRGSGLPGFGIPGVSSEAHDKLDAQFDALLAGHQPAVETARMSTVAFLGKDGKLLSYGTVVDGRGLALSKASEVKKGGSHLQCLITVDRTVNAEVVETWEDEDLALVRIDATDLPAIQWHQGDLPKPGAFLTAPGVDTEEPIAIGLYSVDPRSLTHKNRGFLGIGVGGADKGIAVTSVVPDSAAAKAGLKEGDIVLKLDGSPVVDVMDFMERVGGRKPGDAALFLIKRGEKSKEYNIKLGERPPPPPGQRGSDRFNRMNQMGTELSDRSDGFPNVFQHDLPISPLETGGPVVDLRGNVLGINIARAGRIKTFAVPAQDVLALLKEVDMHKLVQSKMTGQPKPKAGNGKTEDAIAEMMAALEAAEKTTEKERGAVDAAKKSAAAAHKKVE